MPIPSPKLDDRRFDDLIAEAKAIIRNRAPTWTDLSPGDPGITLVELFAFLTDTMLYRLNRIPEKVYIALLDLLGVTLAPPAAAEVTLTFSRTTDAKETLRVPTGTLVSDPSGAVVFATTADLVLASGSAAATVRAVNAEWVEGELAGMGTGEPAQTARVKRPPVIRPLGDDSAMAVGVEAHRGEIEPGADARKFAGKDFVIWPEMHSFLGLGPKDRAYVLDRAEGIVTFAPARAAGQSGGATLGAVPPKDREIRVWYRRGGGRAGNVSAGALTVLKTPIAGLTVTNADRAAGGEEGESVEQALRRGREAVRVLSSAVTAGDFERVATEAAGGIARARAFAHRDVWAFGEPGLVEVRIVPKIDRSVLPDGAVTREVMADHQTDELAGRVDALLASRRPLGVRTRVKWTGCRPVSITARVVVSRAEDPDAVKKRLLARLNELIAPDEDWPFGKTLRASDVYETVLAEPGVRYADRLQFAIEDAPTKAVNDIARDPRQQRTFHVAADAGIFRSLDNGRSWVRVHAADRERLLMVRCHPDVAGMVGAVAVDANAAGDGDADVWPIRLSADGGESWDLLERIQGETVYDLAWTRRGERPTLFIATRKGLRKIELGSERGSKVIDRVTAAGSADEPSADGFFAVASGQHVLGVLFVALAAREKKGVFVSLSGGEPGTFQAVPGSAGKDVRALTFQRDGDRLFLWAGISAEGGAEGEGAMRIEARADGIDPGGWKSTKGWKGGSCLALDVFEQTIVAGSNHAGVLTLDTASATAAWAPSSLDSGLPISVDRRALAPTPAVAVGPADNDAILILAGGQSGLFSSSDRGKKYAEAGQTVFADYAPLPANWLYCSGVHALTVVRDNEAEG